jgi:hypothetical protein
MLKIDDRSFLMTLAILGGDVGSIAAYFLSNAIRKG